MVMTGTVVNGQILLDQPTNLPDGSRVTVVVEEEFAEVVAMPDWETDEEYVQSLREAIALTEQRHRGKSVDKVFDEIDRELQQPVACLLEGVRANNTDT